MSFEGYLAMAVVFLIPAGVGFLITRCLRSWGRTTILAGIIGLPLLFFLILVDQLYIHPSPSMLVSPDAGAYLQLGVISTGFLIVSVLLGIALAAILLYITRKKQNLRNPQSLF